MVSYAELVDQLIERSNYVSTSGLPNAGATQLGLIQTAGLFAIAAAIHEIAALLKEEFIRE